MSNEELLLTREAALYLKVSESLLRQTRMNGARKNRFPSPPFIRLGRTIRYRKSDLDDWLAKHIHG